MSRRNFILLIIVLAIASLVLLTYWYFKPAGSPTNNGGGDGTNFVTGFPNGNGGGKSNGNNGGNPTDVSGGEVGQVGVTGKLVRISRIPVAGFTVFQKEKTKGVFIPALRYVDRASGNVYQTYADTIEERILTKTVVPKIHDALFSNSGSNVFMRYLKANESTVETFGGVLPKEVADEVSTDTNLKSSFLLDDITDLSVAPDGSKIFYLLEGDDAVNGITLDPITNKKTTVFSSPFTEWLSLWPNAKMITLTTKPSGLVPGYMYSVNPDKKDLNKVLGGINGLTTLTSPNGKMVLYGDSNLSLYLFNVETKGTQSLGIRGLPEKCVWNADSSAIYCASPSNITPETYPDSWYQGEVSFDDQIFRVDAISGNAKVLINPSEEISGLSLDGISLALDKSETYLFFVNKKDSGFWKLNLK
jgi:hypothetical protein